MGPNLALIDSVFRSAADKKKALDQRDKDKAAARAEHEAKAKKAAAARRPHHPPPAAAGAAPLGAAAK
jgi:hypothetical protein